MRRISTLLLFFIFTQNDQITAQTTVDCNSSRFDTEVFSAVTTTSNIPYGSAQNSSGTITQLLLNIYEPAGDTAAVRPLIVWAHGGSFVTGTRNDPDIVSLCQTFAKRGYVCASIEYRLGIPFPPSQTGATQAVYRATQDMKAAVRFFRKDAATANAYRIDPSTSFVGGSSAGGFMALHYAYLDNTSEIPSSIDTVALGNLEGNSGNPGYSSSINAVVNLCGALGDKNWLQAGDEPLCSMHGTTDNTVPYATSTIYLYGVYPIMVVDGSYSVNERADVVGVPNVMYT
ncbi:MAG: alpha/beta hydrolase fold domain-containing protein, partial [Bacteroidota bacterium]